MKPKAGSLISLPDNFAVSPRIVELAKINGWPDPHAEIEAFKDKHLMLGSRFADWEAAFRTWLRNAKRFREERFDRYGYKPAVPFIPEPAQKPPSMVEHNLSPEKLAENRRTVGKLLSGLVRDLDARKEREKV